MGEKFGANPVTGTGSLSVPLATSPGRAGFGPSLTLQYDSGSGNGPFGFGWSASMPAITRKTDKGLPRYAVEPDDTFVLFGAEDLVPVLEEHAGQWSPAESHRRVDGRDYVVQRFRPRVEGLFARIERWTDLESRATHWRSITSANVTTVYGLSAASRISDPHDATRVFSWLICQSYDDTGNAMVYEYKAEDGEGVDTHAVHEQGRPAATRTTNRYLKHIKYGNRVSRLVEPDLSQADWLFEVVLDYGEHDRDTPSVRETSPWAVRADPFSSYRSGFEVRTYRLCRRVLMFHHFPDEEGVGADCLVRSTDLCYRADPVASFVESAVQSGYRRRPDGSYLRKSLPPLEFSFSQAVISDKVRTVDPESLENLPYGVDGTTYRWADLDGEGLSGILSEQAAHWYYKANRGGGRFGPSHALTTTPVLPLSAAGAQLVDLAGDGRLDLVDFAGAGPGFYERTDDRGWESFRPFRVHPEIPLDDPELHFVDLTGGGHADILISGDDVFTWYPSLGEEGFGPAEHTYPPIDDEGRPRALFADTEQSVYLADMSADGLQDLVRIRNGEVCYWPSLGYGRFGARVVMSGSPWFDEPDQFDHRRIRLADIDGSGTSDIIYLHRDAARVYLNRAGNSFAAAHELPLAFPRLDTVAEVSAVDLFGNGTACLVWSSPLPSESGRQMRYVDLMGGRKPHLLTEVRNNLGAETRMHYAASTRFYLADERAGRPWVTKLPFPVHVVESVETFDRISRNRFVTRYAYHHGYFDGTEREFRGFGMVEQWDTEELAVLRARGATSNVDASTHVPPVLTRTWFHTGAFLDRERISRHLAHEYYREPDHGAGAEDLLLPDTVLPDSVRRRGRAPLPWRLSPDEARQACRSLKGSVLRQEVYGRDGSEAQDRPYTVSERNYTIEMLQPAGQSYAAFVVHPRETRTANHERAQYPMAGAYRADPRIGHELVMDVDDFGNVLRSLSIGYGRRYADPEATLSPADHERQRRTHVVLTANEYTNAIEEADAYRMPQPSDTRTFELLGVASAGLLELRDLAIALDEGAADLPYPRWDADPRSLAGSARRLVEHARTRYRRDDLAGPLPSGVLESLALPFESYRLAFTEELLTDLYGDRLEHDSLADPGGYVNDAAGWWIPSGRVEYSPASGNGSKAELRHARRHFFLPQRYRDPFGAITTVAHDRYDLLVHQSRDPLDNEVTALNDYRTLQPRSVTDPNGNRSEVAYDAFGLVAGTAVMGKPGEGKGDSLAGLDPDEDPDVLGDHPAVSPTHSARLLGNATTRLVYDLFAYMRTRHDRHPQPAVSVALVRETHVSELAEGQRTRIQHTFTYSDGFAREIQRKAQAEPGPIHHPDGPEVNPRWAGSGWTIFNNKGRPVRQFEPFFSTTPGFEFAIITGVAPVVFYDPLDRVIATLYPNGTWEKITFDAWRQATWDVNDTVLLDPRTDADVGGYVARFLSGVDGGWSSWYAARAKGDMGNTERIAAEKAAAHSGTPTVAWTDGLGRTFLTVTQNRTGGADQYLASRVYLDIEGNERAIEDAESRVVARFGYNLLSSRLVQESMEAGERILLNDVTGKPIYSWNARGYRFRTEYDPMRRPVRSFVAGGDLHRELLYELNEYGEGRPEGTRDNLRTKVFRQNDAAGVITNAAYDFKGNVLDVGRQLAREYRQVLDWGAQVDLEYTTHTTRTTYDALNRPTVLTMPDGSTVRPQYNEANLLERLEADIRGAGESTVLVANIDYNARGQRTLCSYGNGARSEYSYDPLNFRLHELRTSRGRERVQVLRYTYDPIGNVTHLADHAQQEIFFRNRRIEPSADYTYDAIYRLTEATGREHLGQVAGHENGPVPTSRTDASRIGLPHPGDGNAMGRYRERYVYDKAGNILQLVHRGTGPTSAGWTRSYRYEERSLLEPDASSNRLTGTSSGGVSLPSPFSYDPHGNVTSMPELALMQWDHGDQLRATARQVVHGDHTPETTYYIYDATGQRVRKVTERASTDGSPQRTCERIYVGGFELYRKYEGGGLTLERETLHFYDAQQRIALVETRVRGEDKGPAQLQRYQIANHLGSSLLELAGDGRIISYEEYYPYGGTAYQATRNRTEAPKRYRWSGKERDRESGLYYHGVRYYCPWLGRWVSCDPAGAESDRNLYAYVHGNPTRFVDPTGNDSEEPAAQGNSGAVGTTGAAFGSAHAVAEGAIWNPTVAGTISGKARKAIDFARGVFLEKLAGNNLGRYTKDADRIVGNVVQQIKTTYNESKVAQIARDATRDAARYIKNNQAVAAGKTAQARIILRTGTPKRVVDAAKDALQGLRKAIPGSSAAPSVSTGLPGLGVALKVLAPVGAVLSALSLKESIATSDYGGAIRDAAGAVAGTLETVAIGSSYIGTGAAAGTATAGTAGATAGGVGLGVAAGTGAAVVGAFALGAAVGVGLDKSLKVSDYSSDVGVQVYEGLKASGVNDTAAFVIGGAASVAAIPAGILHGVAEKVSGLVHRVPLFSDSLKTRFGL